MTQSSLNGITQPVNMEGEGRSPTMGRQWLQKKKKLLLTHGTNFLTTIQAEEEMRQMLGKHQSLQNTLANINKQISGWQKVLDAPASHRQVEASLSAIKAAKQEIGNV